MDRRCETKARYLGCKLCWSSKTYTSWQNILHRTLERGGVRGSRAKSGVHGVFAGQRLIGSIGSCPYPPEMDRHGPKRDQRGSQAKSRLIYDHSWVAFAVFILGLF
jgi:hypothetical protein